MWPSSSIHDAHFFSVFTFFVRLLCRYRNWFHFLPFIFSIVCVGRSRIASCFVWRLLRWFLSSVVLKFLHEFRITWATSCAVWCSLVGNILHFLVSSSISVLSFLRRHSISSAEQVYKYSFVLFGVSIVRFRNNGNTSKTWHITGPENFVSKTIKISMQNEWRKRIFKTFLPFRYFFVPDSNLLRFLFFFSCLLFFLVLRFFCSKPFDLKNKVAATTTRTK